MKLFLLILFCCTIITTYAQEKIIHIGTHPFIIKNISSYNENGDSTRQVELYRGQTKLLTHTISKAEGDCNSEAIELGTYALTDSTITFYSYWATAGDAPVDPFGARKQVYQVTANGNLSFKQGSIYLETSRKGWHGDNGIQFLFAPPKNDIEKEQLQQYTTQVEELYKASFVIGDRKDNLLKEVKAKLKTAIAVQTKGWKEHYGGMIGGCRM